MIKKSSFVSQKKFYFVLAMSALFILGMATAPAFAVKKAESQKGAVSLVDINTASQKDLESVKGVGAATAKKIIAGRPYKSVDELSKAGLSAKSISVIKPFMMVGGAPAASAAAPVATKVTAPAAASATKATKEVVTEKAKTARTAAAKLAPGTRININTADQATLEKLPDIGPVKAKAIIAGRPYNSVEDIMKVKGIKGKTFEAISDYIVTK